MVDMECVYLFVCVCSSRNVTHGLMHAKQTSTNELHPHLQHICCDMSVTCIWVGK
jgi:hypothetical protein